MQHPGRRPIEQGVLLASPRVRELDSLLWPYRKELVNRAWPLGVGSCTPSRGWCRREMGHGQHSLSVVLRDLPLHAPTFQLERPSWQLVWSFRLFAASTSIFLVVRAGERTSHTDPLPRGGPQRLSLPCRGVASSARADAVPARQADLLPTWLRSRSTRQGQRG